MESEVADTTRELISRIMSSEDYYEILGVERDASPQAIKKRYRDLARAIHPDKCSLDSCEEAFKKVGAAYKCLSHEDTRRTYDLTGAEAPAHPQDPFSEEMFSHMFPQGGAGQRQSGFYTNVQLPDWLLAVLQVIPWRLVGPALAALSLYFFLKLVVWVLSLMVYILPILYLTPARVRWYLALSVLILSWLGYL